MYLLSENALRVLHRVLTGPWRRRVRRDPSSQHGRAVTESTVEGTRAWTALGHREVQKEVSVTPLTVGCGLCHNGSEAASYPGAEV